MLLLVLDIETTGFSRRRHEITVIGAVVYDTAACAERERRCFNVFCAEQTRSLEAVAAMKRDVAALLDRCDAIVAYNGLQFDLPWIREWLRRPARRAQSAPRDVAPAALDPRAPAPWALKTRDFCALAQTCTGHAPSLEAACALNGIAGAKSANGAQAVAWAAASAWPQLEAYCMQDVQALLRLALHALAHGLTCSNVAAHDTRHASDTVCVQLRPDLSAATMTTAHFVLDLARHGEGVCEQEETPACPPERAPKRARV
jgi:hypothetical protein